MKKLFFTLFACSSFGAFAQDGLETWKNYSAGLFPPVTLEIPQGWHGSDSLACFFGPFIDPTGSYSKQIFKSTDKHGGSFAARLVTTAQGSFGNLPAVMANANILLDTAGGQLNVKFEGGVPVTERLDYANAWVKYNPASAGEEGMIMVQAVLAGAASDGSDSVVGQGMQTIIEASAYEPVSAQINYVTTTVVPNRIRVMFYSSSPDAISFTDGTELYVDDVTVSRFPTSVTRVFTNASVKVYPTVTSGQVRLEPSENGVYSLVVYNAMGQQVAKQSFAGNATADLSALAQGVYYYQITGAETVIQKGQLSVVK